MDEYTEILADARRRVARGAAVNAAVFEARIRAVGGEAEQSALKQLAGVIAVQRARARVEGLPDPPPLPRPAAGPSRAFRTRPTITGNMDVRAARAGEAYTLTWRAEPKVVTWEIRFSERPDARADYVVRDESTLPGDATALELPLGDTPFRVHLLGRDRGGRLVRRAIVSALTRDGWNDRWERRASAS